MKEVKPNSIKSDYLLFLPEEIRLFILSFLLNEDLRLFLTLSKYFLRLSLISTYKYYKINHYIESSGNSFITQEKFIEKIFFNATQYFDLLTNFPFLSLERIEDCLSGKLSKGRLFPEKTEFKLDKNECLYPFLSQGSFFTLLAQKCELDFAKESQVNITQAVFVAFQNSMSKTSVGKMFYLSQKDIVFWENIKSSYPLAYSKFKELKAEQQVYLMFVPWPKRYLLQFLQNLSIPSMQYVCSQLLGELMNSVIAHRESLTFSLSRPFFSYVIETLNDESVEYLKSSSQTLLTWSSLSQFTRVLNKILGKEVLDKLNETFFYYPVCYELISEDKRIVNEAYLEITAASKKDNRDEERGKPLFLRRCFYGYWPYLFTPGAHKLRKERNVCEFILKREGIFLGGTLGNPENLLILFYLSEHCEHFNKLAGQIGGALFFIKTLEESLKEQDKNFPDCIFKWLLDYQKHTAFFEKDKIARLDRFNLKDYIAIISWSNQGDKVALLSEDNSYIFVYLKKNIFSFSFGQTTPNYLLSVFEVIAKFLERRLKGLENLLIRESVSPLFFKPATSFLKDTQALLDKLYPEERSIEKTTSLSFHR